MNKNKIQNILLLLVFFIGVSCSHTERKESFNILPLESEIKTFIPPKNSNLHETEVIVKKNVKNNDVLKLKDILKIVLEHNLNLKSDAWQIRSQEAAKVQANNSLNPEIELGYISSDENESEITISQEFELGGKRTSRVEVANKELEVSKFDFEIRRLSLIRKVKNLFFEIYTYQSKIKLFEETVKLAERVLSYTKRRVSTGAAPQVESTRAQLALTSARIRLNNSNRELKVKLASLASMWGDADLISFGISPSINIPKSIPEFTSLKEKIKQNPYLSKMHVMLERQLSVISMEKANRIPNLTVSATYGKNHDENKDSVGISMSFPIPLFDLNHGNILVSQIGKKQAKLNYESTYQKLVTDLSDYYNNMKNSFEEIKMNQNMVIPKSLDAFKDIENLYMKGRESYLSLSEAQKNITDVKISQIEAISNFYIQVSNIESLIGESLENIY